MVREKKRILLITWNYPPKVGGMEQLLNQLVDEISSEVKVDIVAPYSREAVESSKNVRIFRPTVNSLLWYFLFALRQGWNLISRYDYCVLFGGSVLVSPVVFLLSKVAHQTSLVYAHGLDLIYRNVLYQWVIQRIIPRIDLVLTNSSRTREIAICKGAREENTSVLPPGIHSRDYISKRPKTELKEQYNLEGNQVLLYVGRLARRKGVKEFVKYSLPEIVEQQKDLVFCVVGGDPDDSLFHKGNMSDEIRQEAEKLGIAEHVRLFGWVERDNLLDLFKLCDVFVLPAIYVPGDMEGFGIVLAEANAAGKPVVSSRIGGIPDAVLDGKSAILLEPEDWEAYTQTVLLLLRDEELQKEMGTKGQEYIQKKLDWCVIGKRFLSEVCAM